MSHNAALFSQMGTTYGPGDGSTTFNLPDKTGRVSAMKEAVATRLTSGYFGGNSTVMGASGGSESFTLTQSQLPNVTLTTTSTQTNVIQGPVSTVSVVAGSNAINKIDPGYNVSQISGSTSPLGSGLPHRTVQPTIVCNYILRII